MTPITRKEMFLAKLSGEEVTTPDPITREELFLAKLCGESVKTPEPITRYEMFLDGLAGNEHTLTPVTRIEYFIAAAGGADVPELTPITREEMYWSGIEISGVEWTIITGVSPLALADAFAKPIKKLIQFGKVTTVDNETYCNNGKLVAVDDELPSGYERQIGFVFAASTYYLISGFHLRGSDTVRFSFSADKACNVFGCYTTNSATDNYSLYASTSSGGKYLRYDGSTYNSYIPSAQIGERIDVVIAPTGTSGMPTDSVITPAEFEATVDLCIGTTSTSASSSKLDGNIWGNFIVDGRLTLIPCERLSDNVLGYYDPDSDTFYEPIGSAPTSLGVDSSHLTELSVEGTPEVLTVGGGNLLSRDGETSGKIINDDGTVSENANYCISAPFTLSAGNYVCTWQVGSGSRPFSVFAVDESGTPQSDGKLFYNQSSAAGINTGEFTVDAETLAVASYRSNAAELSIVNTAVQTASVVNLFSTGTVHDEQDIISGAVTRRTAISVSGGVITVSALAEPTVEHVTPQPMRTAEGSNTVSVTSAVNPVQLKVEYAKAGA